MKVTEQQLRRFIRKQIIAERSPMVRTGMTSGGKGSMPDVPKKDRDTMVKEIEPQLNAAIESGNTKGIPQGWIDNHASKLASIHDGDPKFSLRRPEASGGPTDEEIMALSKALNPSMFTKFKRMIGMKEAARLSEQVGFTGDPIPTASKILDSVVNDLEKKLVAMRLDEDQVDEMLVELMATSASGIEKLLVKLLQGGYGDEDY